METYSTFKGLRVYSYRNRAGTDIRYIIQPGIPYSPAELIVAGALTAMNIKFHREVSFCRAISPKGALYRYDFFLYQHGIVIEYDGKAYHKNTTTDDIKDRFCKSNGIRVHRLNNKDYYNMTASLKEIIQGKRKPAVKVVAATSAPCKRFPISDAEAKRNRLKTPRKKIIKK